MNKLTEVFLAVVVCFLWVFALFYGIYRAIRYKEKIIEEAEDYPV